MKLRLVPGMLEGWWCIFGPKVARLPGVAVDDGHLTDEARNALEARDFFAQSKEPFAVTMLTATSCNLGCAYCFQNTQVSSNPFAPTRIAKSSLTDETVIKVKRFVQTRMAQHDFESVSLLLFGGEPLLNPDGCVSILRALTPLGLVHADMISNAVLLKASLAKRLFAAGLRKIQVTFDGAPQDHDTTRVDHRGSGTYRSILDNIKAAAECTSIQWQFRVNVSHHNLDRLDDLVEDLGELALTSRKSVRLALIDDVGIGYENALRYTDELAGRFVRLIGRIMDHGFNVPLLGGSLRDCPFCGQFGGTTGTVINADGTLYSCWETAGRPEWSVGTLDDGYLSAEVIRDRWVACDYATASRGSARDSRRFYDMIDAYVLERNYGPTRDKCSATSKVPYAHR